MVALGALDVLGRTEEGLVLHDALARRTRPSAEAWALEFFVIALLVLTRRNDNRPPTGAGRAENAGTVFTVVLELLCVGSPQTLDLLCLYVGNCHDVHCSFGYVDDDICGGKVNFFYPALFRKKFCQKLKDDAIMI